VGNYLLLNGDVKVEAEGSIEFDIAACHNDVSPVKVSASREFKMKSGEIEEPLNEQYELTDLKKAVTSCSAERSLEMSLKGEVKVNGSAIYGGQGHAYLNSLWAVAWIADCKLSDSSTEGQDSYSIGSRFGGWFTLPPEILEEFGKTDAGELILMANTLMKDKLQEMLQSEDIPSPITDPKGAEAKLTEILKDWLDYVQTEWGIFEETE
jgi:hypothetical protein